MRKLLRLASALTCLAPALVQAQGTLDPHALDQLGPAPQSAVPAPPAKPAPAHKAAAEPPAHPNGPHQNLPPLPVRIVPPPPTVPLAPPPLPVLPPPLIVPMRPPTPPIPPTVTPDAASSTAPASDGMRVTFGDGSADLNPDTVLAIRALAKAPPESTFTVTAYSTGTPDDPSTARRLSLARALAVRSLLIEQGVVSSRIYLRAMGSTGPLFPAGPPDRADIVLAQPAPAAAPPPSTPPPSVPSEKAAP